VLQQRAEREAWLRGVWFGETPFIHDLLAVADLVTLPADTLYAKMDVPVLVKAMALDARCLGTGTPGEELAIAGGAVAVETQRDAVSAMTRVAGDVARQRALG
jgi:hypothetical protein